MKNGKRYLLKGWSGYLIEVVCLDQTDLAYKIHNVIQDYDEWLPKKQFEIFGDYQIYQEIS